MEDAELWVALGLPAIAPLWPILMIWDSEVWSDVHGTRQLRRSSVIVIQIIRIAFKARPLQDSFLLIN